MKVIKINKIIWIKENIFWIKDLFWILFTLTATILSFKTYQKAKSTILQPLRTEVIKRQTDLLVSLLDFLLDENGNSRNIFNKLDYSNIISMNFYILLDQYGFVFKSNNSIKKARELSVGAILIKTDGLIDDIELPELVNSNPKKNEEEYFQERYLSKKEKHNNLMDHKEVIIDYLHITEQHTNTIEKLRGYTMNPFIPTSIQEKIKKILDETVKNLTEFMVDQLTKSIVDVAKHQQNSDADYSLSPSNVYNSFQREAYHHEKNVEDIVSEIREHLMIDEKWI